MTQASEQPAALQATKVPMTVYTLVAYRPNGVDTCRGCVMGQSDSDFAMGTFKSADEAAQFWAQKRWDDLGRGREACHWEVTVLINGVSRDDLWQIDDNLYDELEPLFDDLHQRNEQAFKALQDKDAEEKRVQAQKEEQARRAQQARAAQEKRTRDLAELARLQELYGRNSKA